MNGFSYLRGVASLTYEVELCNGCRRCIEVCPHAVFDMQDKRARITRHDDCIECGACSLNCEPGALRVDAGVGCAAGMIVEWWRSVSPGSKAEGCC